MDLPALVFLTIAALVAVGAAVTSWLLRSPWTIRGAARESYECGEVSASDTRFPWRIGFLRFLVVFLLFDLELVLVLPWFWTDGIQSGRGAIGVGMFILTLLWGVWFPIRRGLLGWQK